MTWIKSGMKSPIAFTAVSSILTLEGARMGIIKRQPGERRMGLPMGFPLVDSDDVLVASDRRLHQERRKADLTLEQIELILAQLLYRGPSRL